MGRTGLLVASMALAVLLACGVALTGAALPAKAAYPGDNGRIVFAWDGNGGLSTVQPDGTGRKGVRGVPSGQFSDPIWSPDGSKIAFTLRPDATATPAIYTVYPDGDALKKVADGSHPTWSPDGSKIAFGGTDGKVYVLKLDGSESMAIADGWSPSWSPDGKWIAYSGGLIDPETLEHISRTIPADASWSPGGTSMVYSYYRQPHEFYGSYDLDTMFIPGYPEGSEGFISTSDVNVDEEDPAWSPDGTKAVFEREGSGLQMINVRPTDDEAWRGYAGSGYDPDWQPRTASTLPGTFIDVSPPVNSDKTSASFNFSALDQNGTFECRLDKADFAPCSSPKSYANLKAAQHTFRVRAIQDGKADPVAATHAWTVKPPGTNITSGPSAFVSDTSPRFSFSASRSGSTFRCSLDGATFRSCSTPKTYTGLRDGTHVFRVKAIDQSGNVDPTPAARSWTVDTNAPLITDVRPSSGSTIKDRTPTIAATVRDAQLDLASSKIKLFVDGRQTLAFKYNRDTNRLSYAPSRMLTVGKHTVKVRTEDAVGLAASKSWSFKVVR